MVARDPNTFYINHNDIGPSEEIVSWLAAPKSESEIKENRGLGRLAAMDWDPYPLSTEPAEVEERKDRVDGDGNGNNAKKSLDRLTDYVGVLIQ
jgi:hypothetical protein